jgi:hypothetical protein
VLDDPETPRLHVVGDEAGEDLPGKGPADGALEVRVDLQGDGGIGPPEGRSVGQVGGRGRRRRDEGPRRGRTLEDEQDDKESDGDGERPDGDEGGRRPPGRRGRGGGPAFGPLPGPLGGTPLGATRPRPSVGGVQVRILR